MGVVVADAIDVERGMHLGLDGRYSRCSCFHLCATRPFETVSEARISATCGAPPGDPRRRTRAAHMHVHAETHAALVAGARV